MHHLKTIALGWSVIALLACSTVGETTTDLEPEGSEPATEDSEPAETETCSPAALDTNTLALPKAEATAIHSTHYEEWTVSVRADRGEDAPYTQFRLRSRKFRGSLAGGFGIGLYKIDGDDADLETCSNCIYIEESDFTAGEIRLYVAKSGILSITDYNEVDGIIHGALTDAELVPMLRETGGDACESQSDCPGAMSCDVITTNTCYRPVPVNGACTTRLDLVEF